jgi:hypothetical protein
VGAEVLDGALDRAFPAEADVAVAGAHAVSRNRLRVEAGAVDVELLVSQPVREAGATANNLGADHVRVERVRALPVGDRDDEVVERRHRFKVTGPGRSRERS